AQGVAAVDDNASGECIVAAQSGFSSRTLERQSAALATDISDRIHAKYFETTVRLPDSATGADQESPPKDVDLVTDERRAVVLGDNVVSKLWHAAQLRDTAVKIQT